MIQAMLFLIIRAVTRGKVALTAPPAMCSLCSPLMKMGG